MKIAYRLIALLSILALLTAACESDPHFITRASYRQQVHEQFLQRRHDAAHRQEALFSVLDSHSLSTAQREALEFLYAYMPLCDLADYNGAFFLQQVNAAFEARNFFPWGQSVPEDIFRHFVLVYRINNEYLDTARVAFFEELKDRVKDLSMADAALEVNHWCHEKVTYRGTDGRTSAPLALVKTSWGRCGEESTFTAAALRAVGIPARQCYTPRWVHTNDNHAWVEVWVDGQWHYLGACEPEAELDVAWFSAPAKRTMMVHTTVFGQYDGPEEKNRETPLYATINLLENYAPTREVKVKVVDEKGLPVEGATVKFKVYNYAELYPIATGTSNAEGCTSIRSGMGDLLVWATKDNRYGYRKSAPTENEISITLSRRAGETYGEEYTLAAPPEQAIAKMSPEKAAANALRLAHEDSLRNAYMSTFAPAPGDNNPAQLLLHKAQGNQQEIAALLQSEKEHPQLYPLLQSLSEKDLRDTPADYLRNHLHHAPAAGSSIPKDIYVNYVLSPHIALELIKPWRGFFLREEIAQEIRGGQPGAQRIIDYIAANIQLKDAENYYNCLISPQGVYELKMANRPSRDVFFVALCRSYGIPARIEEATGKPQYYANRQWHDVAFEEAPSPAEAAPLKAVLTLTSHPDNLIKPGYYTHYTLAFFKDGDFQTLDFESNPAAGHFPFRLELDEGYYRLMTGSRANDGSVTVRTEYFTLAKGSPTEKSIQLPEVSGKLFVKGIIDMNTLVTLRKGTTSSLKELDNGRGLMICFVDPGTEPSKHILQDLPAQQTALEEWKGGILLLTPDDKESKAFDAAAFKNLPAQTRWGTDHGRALLNVAADALQIDFHNEFPLTLYLSTNGGILYSSAGYRIGIGEDILKTIRREQESFK